MLLEHQKRRPSESCAALAPSGQFEGRHLCLLGNVLHMRSRPLRHARSRAAFCSIVLSTLWLLRSCTGLPSFWRIPGFRVMRIFDRCCGPAAEQADRGKDPTRACEDPAPDHDSNIWTTVLSR
mmetsp:Transcript_75965/g.209629  ORF Transcript_75965/g.209629 Transcript_75965/m.209629 type:complete len:123 (+) Transcript_75965:167-535(+)